MLLPEPSGELGDEDLDRAYAWPDQGPWTRGNMVMTVDGAARSPDGLSAGISSDADRRVFGRLRGLADVVLAGAGTARDEGYRPARIKPGFAERRAARGQSPVPAIALVSGSLHLDLTAPLFTEPVVPTIVITSAASDPVRRSAVAAVADVIVAGDEEVDLAAALDTLRVRGLGRVHVEGGPHLLADLVAHQLLDELLLTVSPLVAGGGYPGGQSIPRILAGAALPGAPRAVELRHVIEDAGTLFLAYHFADSAAPSATPE